MEGDPTGAGLLAKAKGAASEGFELNLLRTLRSFAELQNGHELSCVFFIAWMLNTDKQVVRFFSFAIVKEKLFWMIHSLTSKSD